MTVRLLSGRGDDVRRRGSRSCASTVRRRHAEHERGAGREAGDGLGRGGGEEYPWWLSDAAHEGRYHVAADGSAVVGGRCGPVDGRRGDTGSCGYRGRRGGRTHD